MQSFFKILEQEGSEISSLKYKKQHLLSELNFLSHEFNQNTLWIMRLSVPPLLTVQYYDLKSEKAQQISNSHVSSGNFSLPSDAFVPGWKFSFKRHSFSYVIIPRKSCTTQPAFEGSKWLTVTRIKGSISLSQQKGAVTVLRKGEREICYWKRKKSSKTRVSKTIPFIYSSPCP